MKAIVKKEGLVIPKRFLKGMKKADVKWENGKIIIEPAVVRKDAIFDLGKHPGHSGIKDISTHHDRYLYEYEEV